MAAAATQRMLYWGSGSPPAWRVAIALEEKQLVYNARLLEFSKNEHKSEEIMKLNPRGQVPVLVDGEAVVCESLAAIVWLDETYDSGAALMPPPRTPPRATAWQRLAEAQVLSDKTTAPFRVRMMAQRQGKPLDEEAFQAKLDELRTELKFWETYLSKAEYLAGASFTLADVFAAPSLLSAQRYGADFVDFPKLKAYVEQVAQRPSVQKTWPPHWKDSPRLDAYKGL